MDGTIIDSNKHGYDAWTKAFEPFETTFEYEDYMKELGAKGEEIAKKYVDVSDFVSPPHRKEIGMDWKKPI